MLLDYLNQEPPMALSLVLKRGDWHRAFFGDLTVRLFGLASWIPVIIWVRHNVADISTIHGPSMHPFLNEELDTAWKRDVVLNWKWDRIHNLQRGMIITFRSVDKRSTPFTLPTDAYICIRMRRYYTS